MNARTGRRERGDLPKKGGFPTAPHNYGVIAEPWLGAVNKGAPAPAYSFTAQTYLVRT